MSDGANKGVTAYRALGTILGGEPSPEGDELASKDEVRTRIEKAPDPCEGKPIWDRELEGNDAYSLAADCITRAFLHMVLEDQAVLYTEFYYDDEHEFLAGKTRDTSDVLWERVMARWPEFDKWIGGASGFQVGFAYSTVRFLLDKPYVGNPAIVELG